MNEIDWHRYCEQYTEFDATQQYIVMGGPIAVGDWYFSDGYLVRCEQQGHASHGKRAAGSTR